MTAYFTDSLSSEFRRAIDKAIKEIEETENQNVKQRKRKRLDSKSDSGGRSKAFRSKQGLSKKSIHETNSEIQVNGRKSALKSKHKKEKNILQR